MNNPEWLGWPGGLAGSIIGILGGVIGTYCSIKNTNGPKERRFMIKTAVVCWIAITMFLALMFLIPNPYRVYLWGPYAILLPMGIHYFNKKQNRIREMEERQKDFA